MKIPAGMRKCDYEEYLKESLYDDFRNSEKVIVSLYYYGNPEADKFIIEKDTKNIWVSIRRAADLIMDSCVQDFAVEPIYQ